MPKRIIVDNTTYLNKFVAGDGWYKAFLRRHPDVSERVSSSLGRQRAIVTPETIHKWFGDLQCYLMSEVPDWAALVNDPRRFFNCDESGFPLCPKSGKVLAPTGAKHVYEVTSSKTQITVLATFNAVGDYLPPMIVYPGKRLRDVGQDGFTEAMYAQTETGWMTAEVFLEFLHSFHSFCRSKSFSFPVILFVDGHSTHLSHDCASFCSENNILLYCFPPNATHVLQPADHALFSPLKTSWFTQVKNWQMEHLGQILTKRDFSSVFRQAWNQTATLEVAVRGFKSTGLWPLDVSAVDYSRLEASRLYATTPTRTTTHDSSTAASVTLSTSISPTSTSTLNTAVHPDSSSESLSVDAPSPLMNFYQPLSQASNVLHQSASVSSSQPTSPSSCSLPLLGVSDTHGNVLSLPPVTVMVCTPVVSAPAMTSSHSSTVGSTSPLSHPVTLPTPTFHLNPTTPLLSPAFPPTTSTLVSIPTGSSISSCLASAPSLFCVNETPKSSTSTSGTESFLIPTASCSISKAFDCLRVPQVKRKDSVQRPKIPCAVSGKQALEILEERKLKKLQEKQQKEIRKAEREQKRAEREEAKRVKKEEKERKKSEKETMKKKTNINKKRMRQMEREDSTSEDDDAMSLRDTSDEEIEPDEYTNCGICKGRDGVLPGWIGCNACPRWYHRKCLGNDALLDMTDEEVLDLEFVCGKCDE